MNGDTIAGAMQLHPGRRETPIASSRGESLARVAVGRPAQDLPRLAGALYTLCAMPHRLAAARAVAAALGDASPPSIEERHALRASQAREQLLRTVHDWPRLLPGAKPSADVALALRACPLWRQDLDLASQLDALPAWLQHKWLGAAPTAFHDDPERWCGAAATPLALLLRGQRGAAAALATPPLPLRLLDDAPRHMPELAQWMASDADFCLRPHWQGAVPDTGPWSRHHDPVRVPATHAWQRLLSRVADVLQLAAPGGEHWLAQGALPLGRHEGMAWVEMARGLLVHWVRVEPAASGPRVAACRVLAPTEWNFHPRGVLATALSGLGGHGAADAARRLAVAFDPCVEFTVHAPQDEAAHA